MGLEQVIQFGDEWDSPPQPVSVRIPVAESLSEEHQLAEIVRLGYSVAQGLSEHERVYAVSRALELIGRLSDKAEKDALTGLYNRGMLDKILTTEVARSRRHGSQLSVIMVDIDHFKHVNDGYGHETGDHVLVRMAALYGGVMRPEDMVFRRGGEEFAIVAPHTDVRGAYALAERLRTTVMMDSGLRSLVSGGITTSAGVVDATQVDDPVFGHDFEKSAQDVATELLRKADNALYMSKGNGRNCTTPWEDRERVPAAVPSRWNKAIEYSREVGGRLAHAAGVLVSLNYLR